MYKIVINTVVLIITLWFLMSAPGNAQVVVSIPDTTGNMDSTIYIPINVDLKDYGVTCFSFELTYNPDVLIADSVVSKGTLTESWFGPYVNKNNSGTIIVGGFFNPTDTVRGAGNLLNLVFTVKGSVDDTTQLKFSEFIFNNGSPYTYKHIGFFKVVEVATSVENRNINMPDKIKLLPNYPDPFVTATSISYDLTRQQHVTIKIFNLLGQEIITLKDEEQLPNNYLLHWDGKDKFGNIVSAGIYYCVMRYDRFRAIEKMAIVK